LGAKISLRSALSSKTARTSGCFSAPNRFKNAATVASSASGAKGAKSASVFVDRESAVSPPAVGARGITEGEQRANAFKRVVGADPQHLNAENRQQQGVPALDVHRGRVREGQEFANASGLSSGRGMHQGGALQHPASGIDRVFEKGQQQLDDVGVAANRGLNQGREPPGVWFKKIQQALARVQQELNAFRVAAVDGQCQRAIWR